MKRYMKQYLIWVGLSCALWAQTAVQTGTISVILLYDGKPIKGSEIRIDARHSYDTDSDGTIRRSLRVGKHLVEGFVKHNGKNLGYFKRQVVVKSGKDTQVIASFVSSKKQPYVQVDTPSGKWYDQSLKKTKATGKGTLIGVVIDAQSKQPVGGARVFVKGTAVDVRTDSKGRFEAEVPAGVPLSFSVVHSAYSAVTVNRVQVAPQKTIVKKVFLTPASMELEEFVVLAPKVEGSISEVLQEEKQIHAIANIVSAEEFSKKGDSDAAAALKRVSGITLVGNDVYIRGLGDRYSNVQMNGLPLPSPNPIKRAVPLNIFPAGVIKSMKVQKSATADIPAAFGGGYVDIRTKDRIKDNYIKVTLGAKANQNTGKSVYTYEGSSSDWTGRDNGYRQIPQDILQAAAIEVGKPVTSFSEEYGFTQETLERFMKEIVNRQLKPKKYKLPIGGKLGIEGAYSIEPVEQHHLSFFGSYTYEAQFRYREEQYARYAYNQQENQLYETPEQNGTVYRTTELYSHALMLNAAYNYADVLHMKYTKLFVLYAESVMRVADGIANSDDDWKIRYDMNWEERTMDIDQLSGDFLYNVAGYDNRFDFGVEWAKADLDQPGNYKYAYLRDIRFDGVVNGPPFLDRYSPNIFLNQTSNDDLKAFYINNETKLHWFSDKDVLRIGYAYSTKKRAMRYNKFQIDQGRGEKLTDDIDTIYDEHVRNDFTGRFYVNVAFQPAYWYDADIQKHALYLSAVLIPTDEIELDVGARLVDFSQTIYEYTNHNDARAPIEKEPNTLTFTKVLPSMSAKYKINDKSQIDTAYSKTYIVPDLREFSDAEFFHPYDVATVRGNPNLKNTMIDTFDIKYSYFFSDTESLKVGLFYKYLDKPIEDVMLPSSSLPRYGFDNAKEATLYGLEIDGRKALDFVHPWLSSVYLSGNFTYADSDVTLREEQKELYTTDHRQLQGLSKTIVNLALSYETSRRSITVSYNKMGKRIRQVGMIDANDLYPDFYEVPPTLVDMVWIEKFRNGLAIKMKVGNLLDDETIWYQGSRRNITNRFKTGRTFSFDLSYRY